MKIKSFKFSLIYIFVVLFSLIFILTPSISFVSAEDIVYTNVLEDLQKDENFNIESYPMIEDDYSLQVIQIAESVNKELFVYVYQPSADSKNLRATTINISTEINENLNYKNYQLTLLNSNDVFYKYRVEDFEVKSENPRYYDISSIYRKFDENLDEGTNNDNTIDEVSFEVSQQWTAYTHENNIFYDCIETEVITVTDKYVGFLRYKTDFYGNATDNHFIAFSTDKDMDRLLEADVYYKIQKYRENIVTAFDEIEENYTHLTYSDKILVSSNNWFVHWQYEWEKIQTISKFISIENREDMFEGIFNTTVNKSLTDEAYENLCDKQWVLRFAETDYKVLFGESSATIIGTNVGEVSILKLKFEKDGEIYNLGVVDNKQTGGDVPSNEVEITTELNLDLFFKILKIVLISLVVIVCLIGIMFLATCTKFFIKLFEIIKYFVKGLLIVIKWIFKTVWWVITAPFSILKK